MRRTASTILGLAISERAILVAEVVRSGGDGGVGTPAASVQRTATFPLSSPAAMEKPEILGAELKKFLRDHAFKASKVVVGLPAKWIMAKERPLPPASASAAASMLRLQAEHHFPPEVQDLLYDFAGKADPSHPTTALLLATSRRNVDRAAQLADAAGLHVIAVTSTTLALAAILNDASADRSGIIVSIASESVEMTLRSSTGPRLLRHLPVTGAQLASPNGTAAASVASLGGELLRASALGAVAAAPMATSPLLIWDGVGLSGESIASLKLRAGASLTTLHDLARLNVTGADTGVVEYGPAITLALVGADRSLLPVDFLHSRLAPPRQRKLGRKVVWAAAAAFAAFVAAGAMVWDLQSKQNALATLTSKLDDIAADRKAATALATKLGTANRWYDGRPATLECLLHVTQAFPQEGTIWLTSLTWRDNEKLPGSAKVTIAGKARSQNDVLAVRERLQAEGHFTDVNVNDIREAGANSRDVAFSISFNFNEGR